LYFLKTQQTFTDVSERNDAKQKAETPIVAEDTTAPPSTIGITPPPDHLTDVEQGKYHVLYFYITKNASNIRVLTQMLLTFLYVI
jgi:hypothetical protein